MPFLERKIMSCLEFLLRRYYEERAKLQMMGNTKGIGSADLWGEKEPSNSSPNKMENIKDMMHKVENFIY